MTTLKEDGDSWKASGIKRRDFRNSKEEPEVNRHKGNKKKNTSRWCRGKQGQEHDVEHVPHPTYWRYGSHVDRCKRCGKELKTYWAGWTLKIPRLKCQGCP